MGVTFFLSELQDESLDFITESASFSVFVFTCIYQQRYRKKAFLSRNYEKFYHNDFLVQFF